MEILFRTPILQAQGWEFKTGQQARNVGAADVIDVNHSGTAETIENSPGENLESFASPVSMVHNHVFGRRGNFKDSGFYQFRYSEPVLSTSLEQLKSVAGNSDPVITEENYPGLHVQAGGVNWQGARLCASDPFVAPEDQLYNALPEERNALPIHDGFNLAESPTVSLQALVHKLAPEHPEASWQIHLDTGEFLIVDK